MEAFESRPFPAARFLFVAAALVMSVVKHEPAPVDILSALAVLCFVAGTATSGGARTVWARLKPFRGVLLPLVGYLFLAVVSLAWTPDVDRSARFLATTLYLAAFFIALVGLRWETKWLRWLLAAFLASAAFPAIALLFPTTSWPSDYTRYYGWFKDPNVLGAYLVPPLVVALLLMTDRRVPVWQRATLFFGIFWINRVFFLAQSRGALVNLVIALAVLAYRLRSDRKRLFALFGWLALSYGLVRASGIPIVKTMAGRFTGSVEVSDIPRINTTRAAVRVFEDNPVFGVGTGAYEAVSVLYRDSSWGRFTTAAHNTYLRLLVEQGLVGLSFFMWFLVALWNQAVRVWRSDEVLKHEGPLSEAFRLAIPPSIAGMLAQGMVIDALHWRHLWLFGALTIIYRVLAAGQATTDGALLIGSIESMRANNTGM